MLLCNVSFIFKLFPTDLFELFIDVHKWPCCLRRTANQSFILRCNSRATKCFHQFILLCCELWNKKNVHHRSLLRDGVLCVLDCRKRNWTYSIPDHLRTSALGSVFKVKQQRDIGSVLLLCDLMPSSVSGFIDFIHMTGPKADWPEPPGCEGGEPP